MKISNRKTLTNLYFDNLLRSWIHDFEELFEVDAERVRLLKRVHRLRFGLNLIPIEINSRRYWGVAVIGGTKKPVIKTYFLLDKLLRNVSCILGLILVFLLIGICGGVETGSISFPFF